MSEYRQKCLSEKGRACRVCGVEDNIDIHHLDGNRANNSVENLVPLCKEHHRAVHRGDPEVDHLAEQLTEIETEGMTKVSVSLDKNTYQYLQERAERESVSFSETVRREVREKMNSTPDGDRVDTLKRENDRLSNEVEYLREALLTAVRD